MELLLVSPLIAVGAACLLWPAVMGFAVAADAMWFNAPGLQEFINHMGVCANGGCDFQEDQRHILMETFFWNRMKNSTYGKKCFWLFCFTFVEIFTNPEQITRKSIKKFYRRLRAKSYAERLAIDNEI